MQILLASSSISDSKSNQLGMSAEPQLFHRNHTSKGSARVNPDMLQGEESFRIQLEQRCKPGLGLMR